MAQTLMLDFDGVICDASNECMMVAWNARHALGVEAFSPRMLARIPAAFRRDFLRCRAYSRHLGHFAMAFDGAMDKVSDQAAFDGSYDALDAQAIERFVAAAQSYRDEVRETKQTAWLREQRLYPGMRDWLASATGRGPLYIVTAKDQASVQAILRFHGVDFPPNRIYGECREKLTAADAIMAREQIGPGELSFVDDNVFNVIDMGNHGIAASWALWGYHAPDHATHGTRANVAKLHLDELLRG